MLEFYINNSCVLALKLFKYITRILSLRICICILLRSGIWHALSPCRIIVMITVTSGGSVPVSFLFIFFFAEFLHRDHRRWRFPLKGALPRSAGGNCTVPGALYVPEVSRDLRFSFVMREAPSDDDVGGGAFTGCARLSRHALMRRRGYGSGLYKVLINGVYALSLCATRGAVFTEYPVRARLWKPMKSGLSRVPRSPDADNFDHVGDILESCWKRGKRDRKKIRWFFYQCSLNVWFFYRFFYRFFIGC